MKISRTILAFAIAVMAPGFVPYEAAAQILNASGVGRAAGVHVEAVGAPVSGVSAISSSLTVVPVSAGLVAPAALDAAVPALAEKPSEAAAASPVSAVEASVVESPGVSGVPGREKSAASSPLGAAQELSSGKSGDQSADSDRVFDGVERESFRLQIQKPGVYVLVKDYPLAKDKDINSKDDSVGWKLTASLQAQDIGAALKARSLENLGGKTIYVTGVEMGTEKEALKRVREAVSGTPGGSDDVKIQILSVPRPWSKGFLPALRDRLVYFLPSKTRDYQTPLRGEVVAGVLSTLLLETPNALYLLHVLPTVDAAIVLSVHTLFLAVYTVWQRTLGNWVLRGNGTEKTIKNYLTGLPFVLNYNVLSHSTQIAAFAHAHGLSAVRQQLGPQAWNFLVTQGLTSFLQTQLFYTWVVNGGFRKWASNQKSATNAEAARTWVNWLLVPWLWVDSIFLTQAATASRVLFQWHAFALTQGHVELACLAALGSIIVFKPWLLDKTLPLYWWLRARIEKLTGRVKASAAYKRIQGWVARRKGAEKI